MSGAFRGYISYKLLGIMQPKMLGKLMICILCTQVQFSKGANIGLIIADDYFEVSQAKTEFPITLLLKVFDNLTYQVNLIRGINSNLEKIKQIPGIRDGPEPLMRKIILQIASVQATANLIIEHITSIYEYRNANEKVLPDIACGVEVKNNIDVGIFTADNFLQASMEALDTTITVDQMVVGNPKYISVLNMVQDAYTHLVALDEKIMEFLEVLESVTSGQVSPKVSSLIQLSRCVESAKMDKVKIKSCEKTTQGLVCLMHVEIYNESHRYLTYVPVNYNGVEVSIPPGTILAKSKDEKYGLLTCREEDEEVINDCSFSTWAATEHLFSGDPFSAILKSNFSLAEPPLPFQSFDTGVVIMDSRIKIKRKTGENPEKDIVNTSPIKISFDANTLLTTVLDQTILNFKGGALQTGVEMEISLYNASAIALMHEKALEDAFSKMDWANILKYFGLIVQVAVLPVAFTTCSLSVYAMITSILRYRKRKRKEKIEKKYNLRRNFEQNKRVGKKVRR